MSTHVYRLTLTFNVAGQFGQSIFHYKFEDGGYTTSAIAADALIDAWIAANIPNFDNLYPDDVLLLSLKARLVDAPGGFEAFEPLGSPRPGARTGPTSVSGVAPVAIFYPPDTNRKRGRWFIPGISDLDMVSGILTDAYVSAINTKLGDVFDDITLAGGGAPVAQFCIYDRKNKTSFVPVLILLSDRIGTLRRRQVPA